MMHVTLSNGALVGQQIRDITPSREENESKEHTLTTLFRPHPTSPTTYLCCCTPHLGRAHEGEGVRAAGAEGTNRAARGTPRRLSVACLGCSMQAGGG